MLEKSPELETVALPDSGGHFFLESRVAGQVNIYLFNYSDGIRRLRFFGIITPMSPSVCRGSVGVGR